MHRRNPGVVSAAVAVGVLLASCGGGGEDTRSDKISGAKKPSASPSASPSDDGIDRPEIKLPEGVKNVFEDRETGDPVKDAVLADNERAINAVDEVITSGDDIGSAVEFYLRDAALVDALEFIRSYREADRSFAGTTRYYDHDVRMVSGTEANITYCQDSSRSYGIDLKKDRKLPQSSAGPEDYYLFNERLKKDDRGVWQTVTGTSSKGAERCMR